nr:TolC family protein [uncultured Acetatifactor sp.]
MRKRAVCRRWLALLLILSLAGGLCPGGILRVQAAQGQLLTLDMAKKSGVANSPKLEKLESELNVKEASLRQAVKSIQVKKKNMSTFRWSPLLSFKFPEKPDLAEAYEFEFKPIQIQAQIDAIKHQMTDQRLQVYEDVSNLYVDMVILEEKIAFQEERLAVLERTLQKNRARLLTGEAAQGDVDAMERSRKALNDQIALDQRNLGADKKKLSELIGMDVTTGYRFEDPFVSSRMDRSSLSGLIEYTLDHDETYYEVSLDATTALTALRTNYQLMEGQYGGKMSYISDFVNQVIAGQKISQRAFKKQYEEFLQAIDEPWQGSVRILFIRIPKEWFKGQISGIRYVEDEPYALYEAALEYQDALLEKQNEERSLRQQVEESFNNLVSMRNAYDTLSEQVAQGEKSLQAEAALNRMGELTYEEYSTSLSAHEELQQERHAALGDYSQALYSFDRLTCGGVTALLEGTAADLNAGDGGESYVEEEYAEGAYYYIEPIVEQQEFRAGVSIPSDFEVEITHFELWCDQIQIGERTEIGSAIRHLGLSVDEVGEVKLRFYNNGQFVDDCIIDPEAYSGPLSIVREYQVREQEALQIGTYTVESHPETGLVGIALLPQLSEGIGYYRIRNQEGSYLLGEELLPIDAQFRHLSLVQGGMEELVIEFFDEGSGLLYTGYFETGGQKLMKIQEGT